MSIDPTAAPDHLREAAALRAEELELAREIVDSLPPGLDFNDLFAEIAADRVAAERDTAERAES